MDDSVIESGNQGHPDISDEEKEKILLSINEAPHPIFLHSRTTFRPGLLGDSPGRADQQRLTHSALCLSFD